MACGRRAGCMPLLASAAVNCKGWRARRRLRDACARCGPDLRRPPPLPGSSKAAPHPLSISRARARAAAHTRLYGPSSVRGLVTRSQLLFLLLMLAMMAMRCAWSCTEVLALMACAARSSAHSVAGAGGAGHDPHVRVRAVCGGRGDTGKRQATAHTRFGCVPRAAQGDS